MKVIVDFFDAVGGPISPKMGADGFEAGPTNSGQYVIARCGRHSSRRYQDWSKIRWGTPLKEEKGKLYVKVAGRWRRLSEYTAVGKNDIVDRHERLYGTRSLPSKWVFNDFGHMTCYYFKDGNHNKRRDRNERIQGEFIHTTPVNEAQTSMGTSVILTESHGCVHVKPRDIDIMIRKGYLRRRNLFIVHSYTQHIPKQMTSSSHGRPPYELHFYPLDKIILVKSQQQHT